MKDLTEEKLLELGFTKVVVPVEESLDDHEYYYFVFDFDTGGGLFTIEASDNVEEGLYSVELGDVEALGPFDNSEDVERLINLAKKVGHV